MLKHTCVVPGKDVGRGGRSISFITWESDLVCDGDQLKQALKDTSTDWFATPAGYKAWQAEAEEWDLGSVTAAISRHPELVALLAESGIHHLSVATTSNHSCDWDFEDTLYEEDMTDEFHDKAEERGNQNDSQSND